MLADFPVKCVTGKHVMDSQVLQLDINLADNLNNVVSSGIC